MSTRTRTPEQKRVRKARQQLRRIGRELRRGADGNMNLDGVEAWIKDPAAVFTTPHHVPPQYRGDFAIINVDLDKAQQNAS